MCIIKKKYFVLFVISLVFIAKSTAQNVSSPYSVLGIGDIDNSEYGRYSATGSASVARRESGYYNFSNPASLTIMPYKEINMDFGFRGRSSKFKLAGTDTFTLPTKDFVVKRVTLAFKVTPTVAFAFGLKPYSSVNYQTEYISKISDGEAQYVKNIDGSGGINQSYFSIAKQIKKGVSIGATASWLFGALQSKTQYYNSNIGLDVLRTENKFYNSAGLQGGIQLYSPIDKKWQHSFGLTASVYTTLKGQNTTDYQENGSTLKTLDPVNIRFKMPLNISAGYSVAKSNGMSYHISGNYDKWAKQKVNYKNSYTTDAFTLNTGMEYSSRKVVNGVVMEKYYIGWGFKMEQSYLVIDNQHLNDYAFTLGGGKSLSPMMSVNANFEIGTKGSVAQNLIKENYFQFNIGLTLKNIWFGTKKFGKFR